MFHGRVQGVGFRYTTHRIAQSFDVAGYVKNLPDRTVEMIVKGKSDTLDSFLGRIQETFAENISSVDVQPNSTNTLPSSFVIER